MTQYADFGQIPNGTGAAFRANINSADTASATMHRGTSAPSVYYARMYWDDQTNSILKRRDASNAAWEFVENYDSATDPTTSDNGAAGWVIGARWYNTTDQKVWILTDPSTTAAWVEIVVGGGGGGGGAVALSGTGTNDADIPPNATVVVVTTVAGSPGVTAGTYRPQPAKTDDLTAEPGACWISGTDEVSVRVQNTGTSTISASALTVTSYVVSTSGDASSTLSGTATIPSTVPAQGGVTVPITVTGAALGDTVDVLLPDAYATSTMLGISWSRVSETDTVLARIVNDDLVAATSLIGDLTAIVRDLT